VHILVLMEVVAATVTVLEAVVAVVAAAVVSRTME
jgi:hypothetical protein